MAKKKHKEEDDYTKFLRKLAEKWAKDRRLLPPFTLKKGNLAASWIDKGKVITTSLSLDVFLYSDAAKLLALHYPDGMAKDTWQWSIETLCKMALEEWQKILKETPLPVDEKKIKKTVKRA